MGFSIKLLGIPVWISIWSLGLGVLVWMSANLYIRKMYEYSTKLNYAIAAFFAMLVVISSVAFHGWLMPP